MMINKPTRLGSILVAVLLVLMPAQPVLASVAILNVQPGPGGKPTVRSVTKETVTGDRFQTNEKEIQQVLLSDGTSLTLGPGSTMVIESFTYDQQTQSGQLNVRLERGQFRIVGGLLNNTGNIMVQTPTGKLDLDSASVFVEVQANGTTRASLLHGKSFKMTTNGKSETVERPAFEVVSTDANQPPKSPSHQDPKMVAADALALNSQSLLGEEGGGGVGDPGGQGSLVLASLSATGNETPLGTPGPPPSPPQPPPESFNRPGRINMALNPSTGFGSSNPLGTPNLDPQQPGRSNGPDRSLAQNRVTVTSRQPNTVPDTGEPTRFVGSTANRIFNSSEPFTQTVQELEPSRAIDRGSRNPNPLQYVFLEGHFETGGDIVALDNLGDESRIEHINAPGGNASFSAPIAFRNIFGLKAPGDTTNDGKKMTEFLQKLKFIDARPQGRVIGQNSIFGDAEYSVLQTGFSRDGDSISPLITRANDNFILVQIRPAVVSLTRLQDVMNKSTRPTGDREATDFLTKLGFLEMHPTFPVADRLPLAQNIWDATSPADLEARLINLRLPQMLFEPQRTELLALVTLAVKIELDSDPKRQYRFLFATGDVDGRLNPKFKSEFSVDRYFISPGLEDFEQGVSTDATGKVVSTGKTVASSIRAFLRDETKLGMSLADTGLYVINPTSSDPKSDAALLHADFGFDGNGAGQKSTISVTIGKVDYKSVCSSACDIKTDTSETSYEAVVSGRTIGSSHDNTDQASVLFSSRLDSTAAGGGNPLLPVEGRAGYFILENVGPNAPTFKTGDPNSGGFEKPLDANSGKPDNQYAYLRLATATGSSQPTLRTESTLNGWMGGLAEFQNSGTIGLTQIDSGDTPNNIEIKTSPANNTVEAKFKLQGQIDNQFTTFNLGGLDVDGTSAFVDDNRFAARSTNNGTEVAMVTADLFRDATSGKFPASLDILNSIPQYEHLKWGFFFGDTKTTPGQREHVHLGTWIAGKIPTGDSLGLRGTATYTGHSIGNVYNNGSLYTAVGSFENRWDFDKRTGTVDMNFDRTAYTGTTKIKDNTFNFDGTLSAPSAPARKGGLQGSFVAPVNPTPAAVMGGFAIAEGNTYRAAGTFGGERK